MQASYVRALHRAHRHRAARCGAGPKALCHCVQEHPAEGRGDVPGGRGVLQGQQRRYVGAELHASSLNCVSLAESDHSTMNVCAAVCWMTGGATYQ